MGWCSWWRGVLAGGVSAVLGVGVGAAVMGVFAARGLGLGGLGWGGGCGRYLAPSPYVDAGAVRWCTRLSGS